MCAVYKEHGTAKRRTKNTLFLFRKASSTSIAEAKSVACFKSF